MNSYPTSADSNLELTMSHLTCGNGWLLLWLGSSAFYFVTLWTSENWARNRKPQEPLHDRAFELIPRLEWMVYLTDGLLLMGCAHLLQMIYWEGGSAALVAKEACVYSAIGNFFSSTLHSVTLLPSSNHAESFPLFGGDADKLMSNHTFHWGLYLRIGVMLGYFPLYTVAPCVFVYSICLAATRAHYAVDVVLAWWALLLVFLIVGAGELPTENEYCMDHSNCYSSWSPVSLMSGNSTDIDGGFACNISLPHLLLSSLSS